MTGHNIQQDERIDKISALLLKYAAGDFSAREEISGEADELDAIIVGLNTLGEEMYAKGLTIKRFEERVNSIMEILLEYTLMNFSRQAEVSGDGDELDAIAVGLNTLAEELNSAREAEQIHTQELEEKNREVQQLNDQLGNNMEKLEVANQELEAFTYSVSHDLRAPLRAIHSYTKILYEDYAKHFNADGKQMMDAVMRNAKKMSQLIDDLLAFSKAGKREMQTREVDMTKLAMDALDEVKNAQPVAKADIKILALSPAVADYNLMALVFINLISNAVKYSAQKENPEIVVGQILENKQTVYYVKDNGVGFDMQYYDKLFGVFNRLHSAEEFEGTGVGLALVKRIILRHGGKIWAMSTLGQGAIFYFTLNKNKHTSYDKQ